MSWGVQMQEMYDRLYNVAADIVSRATLSRVTDTSKMQEMQLKALDGETIDGAERFQNYGFSANPQPGSEALVTFVGADRSHPVIVAVDDRRVRVGSLKPGEVVIYTDEGDTITLKRDRHIEFKTLHLVIDAEEDITMRTKQYYVQASDSVTYHTPRYGLGGMEGGECAATIGADMHVRGDIDQRGHITQEGTHRSTGDQVAGSISQIHHTHRGVMPGSGNTGEPQ